MPRLILFLTVVFQLVALRPAVADLPEPSSRVLPELTATLQRYRTERLRLDAQLQSRLRDIERAYYLKLNSLKMDVPKPEAPKGMFETTEEYNERMARHRQTLADVQEANRKALAEMERLGGLRIQVAESEVAWLEAQVERLSPMADTINEIQAEGCLVSGESATVTVQRPNADAFHFPVTINHKGALYRDTWPYPDRDRAETVWQLRHDLKVFPHYSPEPAGKDGVRLRLTAFIVTDPEGTPLTRFKVG